MQIVHSYDQRVRNNVLTLHQKIKEVLIIGATDINLNSSCGRKPCLFGVRFA